MPFIDGKTMSPTDEMKGVSNELVIPAISKR
jgi:hypothetical protein